MCQAVNELFADEIAELKLQMKDQEQSLIKQYSEMAAEKVAEKVAEMEAEKNALLDEKNAQIAALQAELLKYKQAASAT